MRGLRARHDGYGPSTYIAPLSALTLRTPGHGASGSGKRDAMSSLEEIGHAELQAMRRIVRDEAEQAKASAKASSADAQVARMEAREVAASSRELRNCCSVTRATSRMLLGRPRPA